MNNRNTARELSWIFAIVGVLASLLIPMAGFPGWDWVHPTIVNGLVIVAAIPLAILSKEIRK